jgi:hypothetical protein
MLNYKLKISILNDSDNHIITKYSNKDILININLE